MAGTEISGLNAVVTPLYTDVLPETQLAEVGVNSRKISNLQLTNLINGNYLVVTTTQTLPSPCPNYICYKFTTPGEVITLPAANTANGHPAGKPIWFFPHADNTEDFDINTNDGTTFLTNIGDNKFTLTYSTNATQNGTPIDRIVFADTGSFLQTTGGTLTGNLSIDGGAAPGFSGLDINKTLADSPAQINVYNAFPGLGATAEINAMSEGAADAVFRAAVNGGDLFTWGLDASDSGAFVLSNSNTLGGADNLLRIGQDKAALFYGTVTLNADATTGLQVVSYQQLNSTLTISGTTHTLASTDALRNSVCTNVAGCTITINTASLQDGESANFQSANAAGVVQFSAGTGTVYYSPALCNKLVTNGAATVTRQVNDYYVHGDLTA
jgi:hypothetical protein